MKIEMFQDNHRWRWRLRRKRDDWELAVSTEDFGQRTDCIYAIKELKLGVAGAPVYDVSQNPPAFVAT